MHWSYKEAPPLYSGSRGSNERNNRATASRKEHRGAQGHVFRPELERCISPYYRSLRRRIEKGAARVEIRAFVRPGRRTLLLRCADCVDARFAAAVLAVHGRAERVPVEAALAGSAEALRVQRAIDAASEGGGG